MRYVETPSVPLEEQNPVIIIGAGPVGLCAALGLSFYGVPTIVLDEDEGTALGSGRALFTERHMMEILGMWSTFGPQLVEQGVTILAGRVFFRRRELYKLFNAHPDSGHRYPRYINIPQTQVEALLYQEVLKRACCAVRWQHRVTGITQDGQEVTVEAMTAKGPIRLRAPYVLACDGPRSTVRHLLGLAFPGSSSEQPFLVTDVRMQWDRPPERWFWFDPPFNPGGIVLMHTQPGHLYRVDYQLAVDEDQEAVQRPEVLHRRFVATFGEQPYELVHTNVYTYHQRVLDRFVHGRILFLGDAAHLMSPFGGRRLNSGIQDVWNLVWKVVLVRAGLAPAELLETYQIERHAAAVENLRLTAATMRFLEPRPGLDRWRRDAILWLSKPFRFMRRYINTGTLSNPFTYLDSPIISDDEEAEPQGKPEALALKRFRQGPLAGALAPEVVLTNALTGELVSLLDLCGRDFFLLYFHFNPDEGAAALAQIRPDLPEVPLCLYVISPRAPRASLPEGLVCLLDAEGLVGKVYAARSETLYLVRPDRHIAGRRWKGRLEEIPTMLRMAIGQGLERRSSRPSAT